MNSMSVNKSIPSPQIMYRALVSRDASFEGIFFVGVKTTGIFCRPTCPAKKPKPENIEFFPTNQQALYAGYRPCLRCKPLETSKPAPELVTKLCAMVDQSPNAKISDTILKSAGIEPSTARRQFLKYCGMTFQAYQRARKMASALHSIKAGESVLGAQIDHGFESASGFWQAFTEIFGTPPSRAGEVACLFASWIDTPLGAMLALADDHGLHLLEFVDRRGLRNEIAKLRKKTATVVVPGNNKHLTKIADELKAYFDGKSLGFSVPLIVVGTPFEKKTWNLLQSIPAGTTWSYSQMARKLGNPNAVRAVGRANGMNSLAIVIPCHRVIRADGNLCGYGGGIWRKQWLLEHERKVKSQQSAGRITESRNAALQT